MGKCGTASGWVNSTPGWRSPIRAWEEIVANRLLAGYQIDVGYHGGGVKRPRLLL